MKIGLMTPSLVRPGGGERLLLHLARGLIKNGHEVIIYTINYDKKRCYPALAQGLNIKALYNRPQGGISIPLFLNVYLSYLNLCINFSKLARMIARDTDIINAHGEGVAWLALRLKPMWKGKFIWMCNDSPAWIEVFKRRERHGALRRFKNFLDRIIIYRFISCYDRKAVRKIARIVVLSREMKQSLQLYYKRSIDLLRIGCEVERFDRCNGSFIRERYNIMPQDFLLLHVSLLQPLRRIEDAISAIAILKNDYPDLKMLIAGSLTYDRGYVESLKKLIREKGLDSHIILTGEIPGEEIPLYYGACDGFIFPSDERQTWGLVVFEAMASKRPVIVSSRCGASEVLKDEEEALFITPGDTLGVSTQIKRIIEDKGLRNRLADRGYNFVKENLSWHKYVEGMEEIFLYEI